MIFKDLQICKNWLIEKKMIVIMTLSFVSHGKIEDLKIS